MYIISTSSVSIISTTGQDNESTVSNTMKTRAQLARSRESLYSTMLPLKEAALKEVWLGESREIMMGVGNRVASVIMLTFPSEPCPHADFSK